MLLKVKDWLLHQKAEFLDWFSNWCDDAADQVSVAKLKEGIEALDWKRVHLGDKDEKIANAIREHEFHLAVAEERIDERRIRYDALNAAKKAAKKFGSDIIIT